MNPEYLLDAIGLLDDDLIQEAERRSVPRRRTGWSPWMGLAACLAVVVVLGYGLSHIRMGSGNSASPSGGAPASSAGTPGAWGGMEPQTPMEPAGSASNGSSNDLNSSGAGSSAPPASAEGPTTPDTPGSPVPAIMVDGVVYWSTDTPVPVEVEESAIQTVTSYTSTVPEMDGQTNFSQDLTAQYARIKIGQEWKLVVLMDQEWVLFDPVPPWEK